ncbi:MAG: glycosyltransferase family 39 protein [Spirulina sp.]
MKIFQGFCITVLILGIFLRFYNLHGQVYWHDEAYTSLRISGYTVEEVKQDVFTGEVLQVKDLYQYQHPQPDRHISHVIKALALEDAHHPPLYYTTLRVWTDIFGSSITAIRIFSTLINLLVFPCLYGLCWQLFQSRLVGWMAIAIVAVSPYHFVFAREAREYSLWTVLILLGSALFLRAIRLTRHRATPRENWQNWGGYALVSTLGFYTFPLSGIVAIGQGIYLFIVEKFRWTRAILFYSISFLFSLLVFSPWLAIVLSSWSQTGTDWTTKPLFFTVWLRLWIRHFIYACTFIRSDPFDSVQKIQIILILPLFVWLIGYSFYFLYRQTSLRIWLFILTLTAIVPFVLVVPDIILGGQRALSSRHLVPMYLGIHIAIAYLLTTQIFQSRFRKNLFWKTATSLIITWGLISCWFYAISETSWNKLMNFNNPKVVRAIEQSDNPLLITNSDWLNLGHILSLSHALDPNLHLLLINDRGDPHDGESIPNIPSEFSDIYLFNTSDRWRETIEDKYDWNTQLIYRDVYLQLWKTNEDEK